MQRNAESWCPSFLARSHELLATAVTLPNSGLDQLRFLVLNVLLTCGLQKRVATSESRDLL